MKWVNNDARDVWYIFAKHNIQALMPWYCKGESTYRLDRYTEREQHGWLAISENKTRTYLRCSTSTILLWYAICCSAELFSSLLSICLLYWAFFFSAESYSAPQSNSSLQCIFLLCWVFFLICRALFYSAVHFLFYQVILSREEMCSAEKRKSSAEQQRGFRRSIILMRHSTYQHRETACKRGKTVLSR